MLLKVDSSEGKRNQFIAEFLCQVCSRSQDMCDLVVHNIETIFDFLE